MLIAKGLVTLLITTHEPPLNRKPPEFLTGTQAAASLADLQVPPKLELLSS